MKLLLTHKSKSLLSIFVVLLFILASCATSLNSYEMPTEIDSSARYMFFLHGSSTEKLGAYATHPKYGIYDYYKMVKTLSDQGFTVISESRGKNTDIEIYARKVSEQVNELLAQGVLPQKISVVGFSKGGAITLYISSLLNNPKINYVVMAGCGSRGRYKKTYERFLRNSASGLNGRILSIYDTKDTICGSCEEAFNLASKEVSSTELKLTVGKGHGTFYQPRKEWLIPVVKWINESK